MPTVQPIAITVAYSSLSTFSGSAPIQRQFSLDQTNLSYVRNSTLTQDALYLQYYTASVVIPLSNLFQVCISALPVITWPPIILTQPQSQSVVHPTASYLFCTASAETAVTYQWYSSSISQSGVFYPLTASSVFTGSATNALTMSFTTQSMNGSLFYCVASNVSGKTISNQATLTVS